MVISELSTHRAHLVALHTEAVMLSDGHTSGIVHVCGAQNPYLPLAISILNQDGWGPRSESMLTNGMVEVNKSAQFMATIKMSPEAFGEKLKAKKRSASSYGMVWANYRPSSAFDAARDLVVTVHDADLSVRQAATLAHKGLRSRSLKAEPSPGQLTEGTRFMDSIYRAWISSPHQNVGSGAAMLAYPRLIDGRPLLTGLRTMGTVDFAVQQIVAAKIAATIETGVASGPVSEGVGYNFCNYSLIEGAVPLSVGKNAQNRTAAVGGLVPTLTEPTPDSDLIKDVLKDVTRSGIAIAMIAYPRRAGAY